MVTINNSLSGDLTNRYPATGLSVLIVGAGTAGLFAALECWRKGHTVRIVEKADEPYSAGDGYAIGPSAIKAFKPWSGMAEEVNRIAHDPHILHRNLQGAMLLPPKKIFDQDDPTAPKKVHRVLRPKFQDVLLNYVAKTGMNIDWNVKVVDYYEDLLANRAGVVLADGTRLEADVVVAADGIGTKSHRVVSGGEVPARSSGYSMYRAAYPIENVLGDPAVADRYPEQIEGNEIMEAWTGLGMFGSIWRTKDTMVWSITHKTAGTAHESWSQSVTPNSVLSYLSSFPAWPSDRSRLVQNTPHDKITDFLLVYRDPSSNWTSPGGLVVQIGDAAHAFLPSSGNGATQGIEDAVSLASCLRRCGKGSVGEGTKVHNLLRRDRISCAQLLGAVQHTNRNAIGKDDNEKSSYGVSHSIKTKVQNSNALRNFARYGKWIWGHNPELYVHERYDEALAHISTGASFENTNIPIGHKAKTWTMSEVLDNPNADHWLSEGNWE